MSDTVSLVLPRHHALFPPSLSLSLSLSLSQTIYPLKQLQLVGSVRLPKGVERTKLEVSELPACTSSPPSPPPLHCYLPS